MVICPACGKPCRTLYEGQCRRCAARDYSSPEWRALVEETRARDGYQCQSMFWLTDGGHFILTGGCGCRREAKDLQAAHIVPRSAGGIDDPMNLVTLCRACHARQTAGQDGAFGNPVKMGYMNKQLTREERDRRTKSGGLLPFDEVILPGDFGDDDDD